VGVEREEDVEREEELGSTHVVVVGAAGLGDLRSATFRRSTT
jgi:hypothetical protein